MTDPADIRAQLDGALRELDEVTARLEAEGAWESSELSHLDQHPADSAIEIADREGAMLEATAQRRAEVEAAIRRLVEGSYGRCVDCGLEIDAARLEFRPEVARCLSCQQAFEAAA